MKWVDNHKGVFNVEVVAVSSIHTQVSGFLIIFMITFHLNELNLNQFFLLRHLKLYISLKYVGLEVTF